MGGKSQFKWGVLFILLLVIPGLRSFALLAIIGLLLLGGLIFTILLAWVGAAKLRHTFNDIRRTLGSESGRSRWSWAGLVSIPSVVRLALHHCRRDDILLLLRCDQPAGQQAPSRSVRLKGVREAGRLADGSTIYVTSLHDRSLIDFVDHFHAATRSELGFPTAIGVAPPPYTNGSTFLEATLMARGALEYAIATGPDRVVISCGKPLPPADVVGPVGNGLGLEHGRHPGSSGWMGECWGLVFHIETETEEVFGVSTDRELLARHFGMRRFAKGEPFTGMIPKEKVHRVWRTDATTGIQRQY